MEKLVIKAAIGLAIGWVVDQAAAELLRELGAPPHTAKAVGAVVGALV